MGAGQDQAGACLLGIGSVRQGVGTAGRVEDDGDPSTVHYQVAVCTVLNSIISMIS
jgi:hypothetical protein